MLPESASRVFTLGGKPLSPQFKKGEPLGEVN
jgi:hypothetical protein